MLIVDAGPLYAAAARRDRDHRRCVQLLAAAPRPLVVPDLVVTEVSYLLSDRLGSHAELAFGRALAAAELLVEPVLPSDWARVVELMERYADLPLGMVDASIVAIAERLGVRSIATLDRRHFAVVRPRHVTAFELLP